MTAFRPTSETALTWIHLAIIYGGGLYIYMGYILKPFPIEFDMIGWAYAGRYLIFVGCLMAMAGIYGVYASKHRTRMKLSVHLIVFRLLGVLLFLQMGIGIFYTTGSRRYTPIYTKVEKVFKEEWCAEWLGYLCHGAPTRYKYSSITPQELLGLIQGSTQNKELRIVDDKAPISKLCDTLESRMQILGDNLAYNLNQTCASCAMIKPVLMSQTKWFYPEDDIWITPHSLTLYCQYNGPVKWKLNSFNRWEPESIARGTYLRERLLEIMQSFKISLASIAVSSGFFTGLVLILLHENHRTNKEAFHLD